MKSNTSFKSWSIIPFNLHQIGYVGGIFKYLENSLDDGWKFDAELTEIRFKIQFNNLFLRYAKVVLDVGSRDVELALKGIKRSP